MKPNFSIVAATPLATQQPVLDCTLHLTAPASKSSLFLNVGMPPLTKIKYIDKMREQQLSASMKNGAQ